MKKKLLLAGMLSVLCAAALVSCDKDDKDDDSISEKYEDLDTDELEASDLTLRDLAQIEKSFKELEFSNFKGYSVNRNKGIINDNEYDFKRIFKIEADIYSNDYLELHKEMKFEGTNPYSYGPFIPSGPLVKTVLTDTVSSTSVSTTPTLSRAIAMPKMVSYVSDEKYAYTNNYVYESIDKKYEDQLYSYPELDINVKDSDDSALEEAKNQMDFPTYFDKSDYSIYKIDSTHYLLSNESNVSYTENESYYVDGESKTVNVKSTDTYDFKAVISYSKNEAKLEYSKVKHETYASHYYDDYNEVFIEAENKKGLVESFVSEFEYEYKNKKYDKKNNFIDSFSSTLNCNEVYIDTYTLTFDDNNNVTAATANNSKSYQDFDVLKYSNDGFEYDIQYSLNSGKYYALPLEITETGVNNKVIVEDQLLTGDEQIFDEKKTTLFLNVDPSKIDNEEFKFYQYDGVTYIYIDSETSKNYKLFLKVKVSYNSKDLSYKYDISDVELFDNTQSSSVIYKKAVLI